MKTTTRTRACISNNLHTAFMFKSSIRIDLSFLLFSVLHLDLSKLYLSLSLFILRCLSSSYTHTQHTPTHCTLVYGNCNEAMKHQIQLQSNSSATLSNKRKPGNSRPQIHFGWCMVVPPPRPSTHWMTTISPSAPFLTHRCSSYAVAVHLSRFWFLCIHTQSHTDTHTHSHIHWPTYSQIQPPSSSISSPKTTKRSVSFYHIQHVKQSWNEKPPRKVHKIKARRAISFSFSFSTH